MSWPAIGLLFLSALLHTVWNLLLKGAGEKYIATFFTVAIGSLIFTPFLFITGLPPRELWPLVLISSVVEAMYFLTLAYAYQDHDFSLVYPVARGTAPAFLALWSILFLHETLTPAGLTGLGMIVVGLMVTGGSGLFQNGFHKPTARAVMIALTIALLISIYSLIDGYAVKRGPTLPYGISLFTLVPFMTAPFVVFRYPPRRMLAEFSTHWKRLVVISILGVSSYLLALTAFSIAPLSYAGAIREVSVVIGALAGWRLLGEKMGGVRLLGAAVIFAGILTIALFG